MSSGRHLPPVNLTRREALQLLAAIEAGKASGRLQLLGEDRECFDAGRAKLAEAVRIEERKRGAS